MKIESAIILAAGLGTRLRPATDLLPKPLLPVCGVPMIFYAMAFLYHHGVRNFFMNIHHRPEIMRSFFNGHGPKDVSVTLIEEQVLLGTGGGLQNIAKNIPDRHAFVMNSDIIMDGPIDELVGEFSKSEPVACLAMREMTKDLDYTPIYVDGHGDFIKFMGYESGETINDKKPMHYTGLQVLDALSVNGFVGEGSFCLFEQGYIPLLKANKPLKSCVLGGLWLDCGDWQELKKSELVLKKLDSGLSYGEAMGYLCRGYSVAVDKLKKDYWKEMYQVS